MLPCLETCSTCSSLVKLSSLLRPIWVLVQGTCVVASHTWRSLLVNHSLVLLYNFLRNHCKLILQVWLSNALVWILICAWAHWFCVLSTFLLVIDASLLHYSSFQWFTGRTLLYLVFAVNCQLHLTASWIEIVPDTFFWQALRSGIVLVILLSHSLKLWPFATVLVLANHQVSPLVSIDIACLLHQTYVCLACAKWKQL